MDTFDWIPSYTPQLKKKPRVLEAQFGDGYRQRTCDGINTNPRTWQLTFSARTQDEAAAIMAFLDKQGGVDAFQWTDPNGYAGVYTCGEYGETRTNALNYEVTATFSEEFDPA